MKQPLVLPILALLLPFVTVVSAAEPGASSESNEMPAGWKFEQIGLEAQRRFTSPVLLSYENPKFTFRAGSGALFHKRQDDPDGIGLAHTSLEGDGHVVARITQLEEFHPWGGAGVMFRNSNAPLSSYLSCHVAVKSDKGAKPTLAISTQARLKVESGGPPKMKQPIPVTLPVWLRVTREKNQFTAAWSQDGKTWEDVLAVEFDSQETMLAGLTVWNRYEKKGVVSFDNVAVSSATER